MKKSVKILSLLLLLVLAVGVCACNSCGGGTADPKVVGITLDTSAAKKEYTVGDTFSAEGVTVTARYDNDETAAVALSACEVSSPDMSTAGNKPVTVTYEGVKATYSITVVERHSCTKVCPVCGKCLDATCQDEVCADKCGVSGETYTFEAEDSHVSRIAGNYGVPKVMNQEQADRTYVGNYDAKATVSFCVKAAEATTATLKITLSQKTFVITEKLAVYVNGERLDRPAEMIARASGDAQWFTFDTISLGCVRLAAGDNLIAFYNEGAGVNFDKIELVSPVAVEWADEATFTVDASTAQTTFVRGAQFDFDGLKVALKKGEAAPVDINTDDADLEVRTPDMSTPGKKTVTVVYKRFYVATYEINVEVNFDGKVVNNFSATEVNVKKTAGAGGNLTIVGGHLDNINNNYGASFTFEIYSPAAAKADLWTKIGQRVFELNFTDTYSITVNGAPFESDTVVPRNTEGIDWSVYIQVYVGTVDLVAGKNTITFTVNGEELANGKALNFEQLTLATAETQLRWNEQLEVDASAVKKDYIIGDEFISDGIVVKYIDADSEITLTDAQYTLSSPDMLSGGTKSVTVSYNGFTSSFDIAVSDTLSRTQYGFTAHDGADLAGGARWNGDNWVDGLNGAVGASVTFELYAANNGVATVTVIINTMQNGKVFSDLMSLTVNGTAYSSDAVISYSQPNGWVAVEVPVELCGVRLAQGKNTVVLTMVGTSGFWLKGISLNSTVAAEWYYNSLVVNADGAKTSYNEDETFATDGLLVTARVGGTVTTIPSTEYEITTPDTGVAGVKTVTVTYKKLSATYNITVIGAPATKQEFVATESGNVAISSGLSFKTATSGTTYVDGLNDGVGRTVTFNIHSDANKTATLYVKMNQQRKGVVFTNNMGINVNGEDKTYDTVIDFDGNNMYWQDYWITVEIGTVQLREGDNTIIFTTKVADGIFWFNGITLETSATLTWAA